MALQAAARSPSPRSRVVIVLSGQVLDDGGFLRLLENCQVLVCADGGARHLHRLNILPDLLVGDLDSIDPLDLQWIEEQGVPIDRFPSVKDETDAELAILKVLQVLAGKNQLPEADLDLHTVELVLLGALGGRPDHVLANQLMAVQLAEQGLSVILSDGLSFLYPMAGPAELTLDPQVILPQPCAISIVPVSPQITGLTYTGLRYPLEAATLERGSCRGVSNRPVGDGPVTVKIKSGSLLLILTPEV